MERRANDSSTKLNFQYFDLIFGRKNLTLFRKILEILFTQKFRKCSPPNWGQTGRNVKIYPNRLNWSSV